MDANTHTEHNLLNSLRSGTKAEKEIMNEIQAIIRQITATVTFLPLLEDPCTFDLLVYTSAEVIIMHRCFLVLE